MLPHRVREAAAGPQLANQCCRRRGARQCRRTACAGAGRSGDGRGHLGRGALQEVIVTARKREENLQDVPISIDVFTKKDLQNLGITGFEDYAQKVPAISFISTVPGSQLFVMRGVSDGSNPNYANTSSTGFFVDDMSMSDGGAQPDLHLYDIERIEVLNGPQGTTFGAGSMSGAIRYITNKPDVNAFSAGADFDGGQIQGGQQNWTYQGFINFPIVPGVLGFEPPPSATQAAASSTTSSRPAPGSTAPSPTIHSGHATITTASTSKAAAWR